MVIRSRQCTCRLPRSEQMCMKFMPVLCYVQQRSTEIDFAMKKVVNIFS